MAIDQILNILFPTLGAVVGVVVGATLQYRFSKTLEARRHKQEFLKLQISHLLLPLFIQFTNIDIKTYSIKEYPTNKSVLDELFKNIEIKKIIIKNLYLASPELSYYLLEFIYNSHSHESKHGISIYRSKFTEEEDGEGDGYLDVDNVYDNTEKLKEIIFKEYAEKVRLYRKSYSENQKKWNFKWSVLERIMKR
ncbi:MAG: hypothetical protein WCE94_10415 [Candidatus Methanoperedens sp.]